MQLVKGLKGFVLYSIYQSQSNESQSLRRKKKDFCKNGFRGNVIVLIKCYDCQNFDINKTEHV